MDKYPALRKALLYCLEKDIAIPLDLAVALADQDIKIRAIKSVGDMGAISASYHDAITQAIIDYFTGDRRPQDAKGDFREACSSAFVDGFETGWVDGGSELPTDEDAGAWLAGRQDQEFGFISQLFVDMKELKKEEGFDYFSFATSRADGYVATLQSVYNEGKLRAAGNKMLTFTGTDGSADHICQSIGGTCVQLMGQRHRAAWWVSHDLVPHPANGNYDCGGWNCQHYLEDDEGNRFTGTS